MTSHRSDDPPRRPIPGTDLTVHPLCLGGNVFGWTSDAHESHRLLDAYVAAGGNFVDSADLYMQSVPGMSGGESEEIIGSWLAARGRRDDMVVATKVGKLRRRPGLSPGNIRAALEDSLRRLRTDYVDLYYAHQDDPDVPIAEVLGTFGELVSEGKVRYIGASNFSAPRLAESLDVAEREAGAARYRVLQPGYNLIDRAGYPADLQDLCAERGVACVPYYGLAKGFLTGKYRPGGAAVESPRAAGAQAYLDDRGIAVLAVLDELAATHSTTVAAVSLAWLAAQPTVVAPIASARTAEQLADLIGVASCVLEPGEIARLDAAATDGGATA